MWVQPGNSPNNTQGGFFARPGVSRIRSPPVASEAQGVGRLAQDAQGALGTELGHVQLGGQEGGQLASRSELESEQGVLFGVNLPNPNPPPPPEL